METEMSLPSGAKLASARPGAHHWMTVFFMAVCFATAWWLKPHTTWFEHLGRPEFEQVVPRQFGDWVENTDNAGSFIIDPQQQGALNNLYTQIVTRTYVHRSTGRRIMLSLAYGDLQTYSKQLHRPEACYSSQGFKIESLHEEQINLGGRPVSVNRMTALAGSRQEQVTYFIRIGDKVISGPANALNFARMGMSIKGFIADGLLFRVSELTEDAKASDALQDQFINDLLHALSPAQQAMLIGQK